MWQSYYSKSLSSQKALQLSALLLLTLQNTALVLLTKFSYRKSATPYIASTVIAFSECLKLVVSCSLVVVYDGLETLIAAFRDISTSWLRLSLPSVLYVLQNNLLFEGVRLLSPTVYISCSQSKILTSALFGTILLKTRITRKQCISLCMLVVGMIMVQIEREPIHGVTVTRSEPPIKGVVLVFTASITSGFAGAYLEKMYKEVAVDGQRRSIWYRNAQLACFSVPVAFGTLYWRDGEQVISNGALVGYDDVVVFIIVLQAVGGLIVAAVMRYASNLMKCFAVSLSICNCIIATAFLFGDGKLDTSVHQAFGVALIIGATFAYASKKT